MAVIEEARPHQAAEYGPNGAAVVELIGLARRLSQAQVRAIAGAVAWQWQPLAIPVRGTFATARSQALAAAKVAGRQAAATFAVHDAGAAVVESPGAQAISGSRSSVENGLAAVVIGVIGAIGSASAGVVTAAAAFGVLAVVGGIVLLMRSSGRISRERAGAGVAAAALALVVGDLISPEARQSLWGPWSAVMRD
jgi:hypothetical protein